MNRAQRGRQDTDAREARHLSGRFRETIRYELAYQLRRPIPWLFLAVLTAVVFLFTSEAQIAGARSGDTPANAPFNLALGLCFGGIFALLPFAYVVGEAGGRDVQSRMAPLLYTTPVGKGTYLGGRLVAALVLALLLSLALPAGFLGAILASDVDPVLLGPVRLGHYAGAWLGVALPNVLIVGSFAFAAATYRGRAMAAFGAAASFLVFSLTCALLVGAVLNQWTLAGILDPLAITPLSQISKSWGPLEQRTGIPYLTFPFLRNRALWLLLSAGVVALTHRRFRFAHATIGAAKQRAAAPEAVPAAPEPPIVAPRAPRAARRFDAGTHLRQLLAIARESYRVVVLGWGGLVMLILGLFTIVIGPELMEHVGVPFIPVTARIADYLGAPLEMFTTVPALLIAYYAGELVWRDRDAGLGEIAGAAPVPDWTYLLGRTGGLALALATFQAVMMTSAMAVQMRMGHFDLEPWLHVRLFLGMMLADWLLFVALAVAAHVVVAHKYVGHLVMGSVYAFSLFAGKLGVEQKFLVFAGDPGWSYGDFAGFGRSLLPWLVLEGYWAAWSVLLLVAATLLWMRGRDSGVAARLRLARGRLTSRVAGLAAGAAALVLLLGGFTFYNTNVLNAFVPKGELDARRAEFERRYGKYRHLAQPQVDLVRVHAELHPDRGTAEIRGSYRLVNRGSAAVAALHVAPHLDVETGPLTLDRAATLAVSDDAHRYRVLALAEPLQPGDSMRLDFTVRIGRPGFTNKGADPLVPSNGIFLRNFLLPSIGYQPERELTDPGARTAHGLPPRRPIPDLDDAAAHRDVSGRESIMVEATVVTDTTQHVVAPGVLLRRWTEGGRRHFRYATEHPIRNDFAIFAGRYAVKSAKWRDVELEVVYHPAHGWNVDGMLRSLSASLEHLTAVLGPYPHRQLRLVEHPGESGSLHAFPINVSFTEGFAQMNPKGDPRGVDFPFGIVAHEVAHQWWGGQLQPAPVEGAAVMSETLAWYSALGVVEHARGRDELERVIGVMRDAYELPRAPADPPLLRASGWFLAYRKGPLAMVALREYVGKDAVNSALRRLLAAHATGEPPLPTTRDLYRELEAVTPDSLRYLVHDLFAANTVWELSAETLTSEPAGDGMRRLTFDVKARKLVIDTLGVERDLPMNDLVEIGAWAGGGTDEQRGPLVYRRLHRIRTGTQRITITVPATANEVAVDPRRLLFDFDPHDNDTELAGKD